MLGLEHFFANASHEGSYLAGHYHPGLVLLSLLVSIFSATMALQTAHIARKAESPLHRHVALATGAVALGGGVWTTHFVGMLSFGLPTHVHYALDLTVLSFLPAVAASWFALRLLTHTVVTFPQLIMSGMLVGLGVAAMHYCGMAAMQTPATMRYDAATFVLSILVAIVMAIFALWIRYGLRHVLPSRLRPFASGAFMGLAIASMHYMGMAAVRFIGEPGEATNALMLDNVVASLVLSAFTVTVTILVIVLNSLLRSRGLYRRMEESRSRLNAILDTAVDGIITIDQRGRIQSFNHSAERLFGWKFAEVVGRNIKMLMPEPDQSRHDGYLQNYLTSGIPKIIGSGREVIGLRKDGSLMPMRLAVGRVDLPGELLFVGFVTDITDRHELEASLRETAERAEQAAAAKSTFLANMSHEIRTPMNSIIGFTELLLQRDLGPTERSHLNTIRQSSLALLRLLNDILDTTKMEKGRVTLESIDFSFKGLAMQIESSLRLAAHAKRLTLTTHYPDDMPEYFRGDPLRVVQVLTNLVGNAIKFTHSGSVDVDYRYEDGNVHVRVIDTGIGMTQQQIATIFRPFSQADASISRRFGGTGLGTTIARQLVELMEGSIDVNSEPGRGSVFHVRLPLPLGTRPPAQESARHRPGLPQLKILVADDVELNLELLTLLLGSSGHQVDVAENGDEAVTKFIGGCYDVVLMDVHMPGTDGLQATQLIRQYERVHGCKPTPIIALTASVMDADRHAARQAGMDGFATKPVDGPRLFDEIARVLALSSTEAEATRVAVPDAAASTMVKLIDWGGGVALWGSPGRLTHALEQFLQNMPTSHPLPENDAESVDWDVVRFSVHGLRGAAGNLGLPAISELAGRLEEMIDQGALEAVRPGLAELRSMLDRVGAELRESATPASGVVQAAVPEAEPAHGLRADVNTLYAYLKHGELDDEALDKVSAGLSQAGETAMAQRLRSLLEAFEFAQAQALLQEWLAVHENEVLP